MVCGIVRLKKSLNGIILKQWDNVPRKNLISVASGIQIPFHNDEISAKSMCNASPDQHRTLTPKTILFKYATVGITFISPTLYSNPAITSMNGKPRLVREKKKFHCCEVAPKHRKHNYGPRAFSPPSRKQLCTVLADVRLLFVPWMFAAVTLAVWMQLLRWVFRI